MVMKKAIEMVLMMTILGYFHHYVYNAANVTYYVDDYDQEHENYHKCYLDNGHDHDRDSYDYHSGNNPQYVYDKDKYLWHKRC